MTIDTEALVALAERLSRPLWEIIAHEGWYAIPTLKADAREALSGSRAVDGRSITELVAALRAHALTGKHDETVRGDLSMEAQ